MNIIKFFVFKVIKMLSLLIGICIIVFLLLNFYPFDPVEGYLKQDTACIGIEQRGQIESFLGVNKSLSERFTLSMKNILQCNFGISTIFRCNVTDVIKERFFESMILLVSSFIICSILGIILGAISGVNHNSIIDKIITSSSIIVSSTPAFLMGILLLSIFSVYLGWFPIGFSLPSGVVYKNVSLLDKIYHAILPIITISIVNISSIVLFTRQKTIDVMNSDYITYARTKGEYGLKLFLKHGFINIITPIITLVCASFSEFFGSSILIEQVFSYPGLGQATVLAGIRGDTSLFLALTILSVLFVFIGNLLADIIYYLMHQRCKKVNAHI